MTTDTTTPNQSKKYIVSVSGGLGSAEALKRSIELYGKENVIAIFADVKGDGVMSWLGMPTVTTLLHERYGGETHDTYRFIWQLSYALDIDIIRLDYALTIWDIFYQTKSLSPMVGVCKASELLKRIPIKKWIEENITGEYAMILGMGWEEEHRVKSSAVWWSKNMGLPVEVIAPNAKIGYSAIIENKRALFVKTEIEYSGGFATNEKTALWLVGNDCQLPSAYQDGLSHNNCGGACVLGGLAHYARLYAIRYMIYMYTAWLEYMFNRAIGKNYSILRNLRKGNKVSLSLYDYASDDMEESKWLNRPNIHTGDYPKLDTGACTCFTDIELLKEYVRTAPTPRIQLELL